MEYWTIIDDLHAGPFSAEELVAKGIGLDTPVWISGLPDWVEAREIQELRELIEARYDQAPAETPAESAGCTSAEATEEGEDNDEHANVVAAMTNELPPAPVPEPPIPAGRPAEQQPSAGDPQQPQPQGEYPQQPQPQSGYPQQPLPPCPPQGAYPPAGPGYPPAGPGYPPPGYYPQSGPMPWQPTPPPQQHPRPQRPAPRRVNPEPQPQPKWEWQQEPKPIPEGAEIPPAYLVWAIISTVLCCIPLGIPAIVFSTKTRQAIKQGDLEKARKMSDRTQWFIILAIVLGLISMPLQLVFSNF